MCYKYSDSGFPGSYDEIRDSRSRANILVEGSKPSVEELGGREEKYLGRDGMGKFGEQRVRAKERLEK